MTVLVAPDSFKGTYPAAEVAAAIAAGIRAAGGTAAELPVADGGEGTFDALCSSLQATAVSVGAQNPWGEPLTAAIGLAADGTAVVELAQASGLTVPSIRPRDAVSASTYGTGMMVAAAVDAGATHIMVAAGGSATTDGGAGAVQAIHDGGGLRGARLTMLSDVTSTFLDAPRIFGPQKGAGPAEIGLLEQRLRQLAGTYPRNPVGVPRTGAAGGLSGTVGALWRPAGVRGRRRPGCRAVRPAPGGRGRRRGG
jgi:glycerate kinase